MRDDLLLYYERELNFLRQMGAEFADKYPRVAARLLLESDKCEDPHVERLLESFALLAARVHLKIDDEFPEITEALLSIVYPHYVRPFPSASIVQFHLDADKGGVTTPQKVPRASMLRSDTVGGVPCQFQTCFDTTVWPMNVAAGQWTTPDRLSPPIKSLEASNAVRFEVRTPTEVEISKLGIETLRIHLAGDGNVVHALYELLNCNVAQIIVRDPTPMSKVRPVVLRPEALRPVGFEEGEGLIPFPRRSFLGYRILQEYFVFPEKFFFLDLTGLEAIWGSGFKNRMEVVFLITQFEQSDRRQILELGISDKTFRLNSTPIINLFPQTAEPIMLDQRKYEYPIVPDIRRPNATEVFSVDSVVSINPQSNDVMQFEPFYSYRHATLKGRKQTFWMANRRVSGRKNDEGTEVYLSMVDLSTRPVRPDADTLTVRTTCTNRDLPAKLPFGNEAGDFELESGIAIKRIVALRKPTNPVRPPVGRSSFWRLISHLSLNYLSLVSEGREALQEILKLYNFTGTAFTEKHIDGIISLESRRHFTRLISENGISFARGTRVEIEFDEEMFVGGGAFLFAAVLENFLGHYATLNSFSQLVVRTKQRKEIVKEWPPRAGRTILL
ncbi:MAG: type VI secretion system baseplate subunit TssF [Bryobacteraceae bacterium]